MSDPTKASPMADDDLFRAYYLPHEAWYASSVHADDTPSIGVQMASTEGECAWEFMVRLHDLGQYGDAVRIEMFDDSWPAFRDVPDLFAALAELGDDRPARTTGRKQEKVTLDHVRHVLTRLGFKDITERTRR